MIELKDVYKVFEQNGNKVEALKGINLKVEKGDIFGVIGFSGAGKSTLLRTVNFLEKPTSGHVFIDGKDLASLNTKELRDVRKQIGMVFQHFNLLNSKTVFDNIATPLILNHTSKIKISERVNELLKFVGLESKAKSYPDELSGGQKQRVGIARALATNPLILLCDEATSALDPQTTESILELLKKVNKEYNVTILLITHQMNVIQKVCSHVAVMEKGKIIEVGDVLHVFGEPKEETTKNFVHSVTNDDVPESVLKILKSSKKDNINSHLFKLKFIGGTTGKPLISLISKKFDIDVNVLNANVTELQEIPMVNMVIQFDGESEVTEKIYSFIKENGVYVEEVEYNEDN